MKKLLCLALAIALCAGTLSACNKPASDGDTRQVASADNFAPTVTQIPEGHGEEDQSLLLDQLPTVEPLERLFNEGDATGAAEDGAANVNADALLGVEDPLITGDIPANDSGANVINPSTYQFSALTDTTLGFTFNYPAHWENVPGIYTVCFRESAEPGEFPARVAVTRKDMIHSVKPDTLADQLTEYLRVVRRQYDTATFEVSAPNMEDTFMSRSAYSATYLAYSGDTEVEGFIIGTAVGKTILVFHFCAAYDDYAAMAQLMRYMLLSVQPVVQ